MSIGPTEITLIVLVIILLFGASKLPDLARGTGSALRIFKTETKGLLDDDTDTTAPHTAAPTASDHPVRGALSPGPAASTVDGVATPARQVTDR